MYIKMYIKTYVRMCLSSLDYVKGVLDLGFNLGSDWIFNLNFNSNFNSNFNMNFSLVFNLAFRFLKWGSGFLKRPLLFLNREFKFLKRVFRCLKRSFFVFTVCVICIVWGKSDYLVEAKSVISANTSVDMQVNTSANMPANKSGNNNLSAERTGFIFTGDSRIRRLNLTVDLKSKKDTFVVCKSGMGYNWFVSQGLPQINNIMKSKKSIDKWVIVSGWGVNDLWNRNTYINRYKSLLKNEWKGVDLYLMSVNPVDGAMLSKYGGISSFNSGISSTTTT